MHSHGYVGLDHVLPDSGQYYVTVGPNQIIVSFGDVRADDINVKESLSDEVFHALEVASGLVYFRTDAGPVTTYFPSVT